MNDPIVIDGRMCRTVDARDRGLAYGHGVFETMRLWQGRLPLWQYHEFRLKRGLRVLGIPCPDSLIQESIDVLLAAVPPEGVVKLTVTAGVTGRGYGVKASLRPIVIAVWGAMPECPASAITLAVSDYRLPINPTLAGIKHLNRLDQVLAAAAAPEGAVPLLLDAGGNVVEALSHNIFILIDDGWVTPDLSRCGVAGVMRSALLERVFGQLGLEVIVSNFGREVLTSAHEIFICNSVAGVQRVGALLPTEAALGREQTEAVRAKLAESYPCYPV